MTHPGKDRLRVALVQLRCGREMEPNLGAAEKLIRQAAAGGAEYVQTPENTSFMELEPERVQALTPHEKDNAALHRFQAMAKELAIWLHVGSLATRVDRTRMANRSYLIGPDAEIKARYDKLHMFDVDLPNGETYRESRNYQPGEKAVVVDLPQARLGMSICYDLRFPQLYRALASAGADLIAIPAAFTKQTGEAHWRVLLRARAIETGAFIVAATQGGLHENGRATYGHSMVVSPWGDVLAEAGEEPGVVFADLNLAESVAARTRIPNLRHGREIVVEIVTGGAAERTPISGKTDMR